MAENVLGTIFGRADALKRQLYDMIRNPSDYASMVGGRTQENLATAQALQNQAFGDPQNPLRITNPQALNQLTQMITSGPLGFAPAGITAYHGSPYLFRQFDPMKVGTGEGAQAYGVGSGYTAESRGVAEAYRDILSSPRNQTMRQKGVYIEPSPMGDGTWRLAQSDTMIGGIPQGRTGDITQGITDYNFKNVAAAVKYAKKKGLLDKNQKVNLTEIAEEGKYNPVRSAKEMEDSSYNQLIASQPGYLYKGDIPDEILPKFLDWDKPLSQQSEDVRNALKRRIVDVVPQDKFDMGGNARLRDNRDGKVDPTSTSPWLMEATDASGTKFFGLTQKDVDRMFGSKDAKDLTGEQIYARLTQDQGSQQAASAYLDGIGVRGIRYLDQVSRGEGKGTSNFVPFRPEDFKIQEINDIPIQQYIEQGLL